jgi:hypothetical protein
MAIEGTRAHERLQARLRKTGCDEGARDACRRGTSAPGRLMLFAMVVLTLVAFVGLTACGSGAPTPAATKVASPIAYSTAATTSQNTDAPQNPYVIPKVSPSAVAATAAGSAAPSPSTQPSEVPAPTPTPQPSASAATSPTPVTRVKVRDAYQGGIVAYIFQSGDPGYVAGETHGLIAARNHVGMAIPWSNGTYVTTRATGTGLGWGPFNTDKIIAAQGPPTTNYAAGWVRAYRGGGYADWFLPSADELEKVNLGRIGGLGGEFWTSSEVTSGPAQVVNMSAPDPPKEALNKDAERFVVAVRAF